MQASNSRRIRKVAVAVMAVAALTSAGVSAVGVGSAHASNNGVGSVGGDTQQWAPTYTCDTLANLGNNLGSPGAVVIKGTGNCVASNGAPTATGFDGNDVSLVARSDGTVYHCYAGYLGATFVNLPTSVESIECIFVS
ncbi:MAG: hypothetical protein JO345_23885 [Streptosporangiaceae bacterium]|nr:hypothetical protein [Streptosporangiaceae bacterium]